MEFEMPEMVGPYRVVYKIGEGSFSHVYQGYDPIKNKQVALKFIDRKILDNSDILRTIEIELRISNFIKHENIVTFQNVYYLENYIVLVMECLSNGTITMLKQFSLFEIDYHVYLRWGKDILKGLEYLHSRKIAHHDIKPENIGFDSYMNAKILDLGLCEEFQDKCFYNCGTPAFNAPELSTEKRYDGTKSDIWAFGVTFHYLVTGTLPFANLDHIVGNKKFTPQICNKCPEPLKNIVDLALEIDPEKRPSATSLLNLEIFKEAEPKQVPYIEKPLIKRIKKPRSLNAIIIEPILRENRKLTRRISDVIKYKNPSVF